MTETQEIGVTKENRLASLSFTVDEFAADWQHCDQLANYLSRAVSFDKPDSFVFANLLSTVLNEILETMYREHSGGALGLDLHQAGTDTVIVARIPVADGSRSFYENTLSALKSGDAGERYRNEMMKDEELSHAIGFYELAADYDASVTVSSVTDSEMSVTVRVNLDDLVEVE